MFFPLLNVMKLQIKRHPTARIVGSFYWLDILDGLSLVRNDEVSGKACDSSLCLCIVQALRAASTSPTLDTVLCWLSWTHRQLSVSLTSVCSEGEARARSMDGKLRALHITRHRHVSTRYNTTPPLLQHCLNVQCDDCMFTQHPPPQHWPIHDMSMLLWPSGGEGGADARH